jgi:hypothetical protein
VTDRHAWLMVVRGWFVDGLSVRGRVYACM